MHYQKELGERTLCGRGEQGATFKYICFAGYFTDIGRLDGYVSPVRGRYMSWMLEYYQVSKAGGLA